MNTATRLAARKRRPSEKRRSMARLERIFFAIGVSLLALWGTATLHTVISSRLALAAFDANQSSSNVSSNVIQHDLACGAEASFASWSIQRVHAYKNALLQKFDSPIAVLNVPKIHLEVPVFDGTDDLILNRGVGRIAGTALIGAEGNLGIAGHRDGFFRGLEDVTSGDVIILARPGHTDFYVIDAIQVVDQANVSVLKSTPAPSLTLVTCFPFYYIGSAPQRYIVRASLRSSSQSREGISKTLISLGNLTDKENRKCDQYQ
jgi:sortase A